MAFVVGDICRFGHHHAGVFTPVGGAFEPAEATSWPIFPVWTANSLKVGVHLMFPNCGWEWVPPRQAPPTLFDQGGETDRRTTLDVCSLSLNEGDME